MEACAQILAMHNAGAVPDPQLGPLESVCYAGTRMGWEHSRALEGRMYMYKTFDTPGGPALVSVCFLETSLRCMTVVVTFTKGLRARHAFRPWAGMDTAIKDSRQGGDVKVPLDPATMDYYSMGFDAKQVSFLRDLHSGLDNLAVVTIPPVFNPGN